MSGDVLAFAYEKFKKGEVEACLELCAVAMESDGIEQLVKSILEINAESDIGVEAAGSERPDGSKEPSGKKEIPESKERPDGSEDPSGLKEKKGTKDSASGGGVKDMNYAKSSIEARLNAAISSIAKNIKADDAGDEDAGDDDEGSEDSDVFSDMDFDSDDEAPAPEESKMSQKLKEANEKRKLSVKPASKTESSFKREQRALANKIALSGKPEHKRLAREVLKG